jgi:23S rRNA G2445 N2-methylase RlmL
MTSRNLAEAVKSSGYTPAARDGAELIALLANEDDEIALGAERALARLGEKLVGIAERSLKEAPPRVRARLCRAIARVALLGDAETKYLILALDDDDPKTRRNAAIALGKSRVDHVETALLTAWDREKRVDHLRSLAASLGKVGSEKALSRLRALPVDDPALARIASQSILILTRTLHRSAPSAVDGSKPPPRPVPIVFRCRSGLEQILESELGAEWKPRVAGKGEVHATLSGPLDGAFVARTALEFALLLPTVKVPKDSTPAAATDAIAEALTSPDARLVFDTWTQGQARYRIAWAKGGHRRADVWRVAKRVSELAPELVNDPTESTWDVLVQEFPEKFRIEISPKKLVDPRFAYRERDVPAASHPTLAAALARIAGTRADDVVWDPFVGSATDLIERARLGAYRELYGSDIDSAALDAARVNLKLAGVHAELTIADACTHAPRGVTLILTNPPMGHRVLRHANLAELLERFIAHAATTLAPGGRLVWISPMGERTKAWAHAAGLGLELAHDVDMGGFTAQIQVLRK